MSKMTIIGLPQSTYVRVVRMAASEKGIDYDYDPKPPHSDEVNEVHPLGKIPVMHHGDVRLCESRAITGYMDKVFNGPRLVPDDPVKAAKVEQWVSMVNTSMDRTLIRDYLFSYLFPKGADGKPDRPAIDALLPVVEKQLRILDRAVAANGELACDTFTVADLNVLPILFYLSNTPEGGGMIEKAPALSGYYARHSTRPSFVETIPPGAGLLRISRRRRLPPRAAGRGRRLRVSAGTGLLPADRNPPETIGTCCDIRRQCRRAKGPLDGSQVAPNDMTQGMTMRLTINDNRPRTPAETVEAAHRARSIAWSAKDIFRRLVARRQTPRAVAIGTLTPAMRRDLGLDPSWADAYPNVRSGMPPFDGMVLGPLNDNSVARRRAV